MKTILFLILINITFNLSSQSHFAKSSRYFYWGIGFNSPPHDVYSFIDSLFITSVNDDTINFSVKNDVLRNGSILNFLKIKNRISLLSSSNDTILLYDFDMNINDTFELKYQAVKEQMILDSVVSRKLENGLDYRHFYLHTTKSNQIVWVENIGEKHHGWDYRGFNMIDKPGLCAVCSSDSLVWSDSIYYWDFSNQGIKLKFEKPNCSFYELAQKVSLDEIFFDFKVYPIPANSLINIKVYSSNELAFEILTLDGRKLSDYTVSYNNNSEYQIDISNLESGVYQLVSKAGGFDKYLKFVKVD